MDWVGAATLSSQDEPDLRFFSNDYSIFQEDTLYNIQEALYNNPSRYFRTMTETNFDGKVDFEVPFRQWLGLASRIKFGGSGLQKERNFTERRFEFEQMNLVTHYDGNPSLFWADANLGQQVDSLGNTTWSQYLQDNSERRNQYTGSQHVLAAYAMTELALTNHLRFVGGVRFEATRIELVSEDRSLERGILENNDFLPSANLIYSLKNEATNKMNLRASYSRTLARPTFRELAPFASFDFVRDFTLIGNPNLERTLIDNYDLRWEWMPSMGEMLSVSAFTKHFQNPIERVINPTAANLELNYRNVPEATAMGLEFEARKSLAFLGSGFKWFRIGANLTLISSKLDINAQELAQIRVLNPDAAATRAMYGQSPYTINAELSYLNDTLGISSSLNFNVWGDRISDISSGGTPNVYERSRPSLDYSISKNIVGNWSIRLRARNLLNPEYKRTYLFKGEHYDFQSYRVGRSFSVGISYTIR
jgi:TonB-dependent receptor